MSPSPSEHVPVLLDEVIGALVPRDDAVYVDGTFGGGGYSAALLAAARPVSLAERWAQDPDSGAAKLGPIAVTLELRARRPELFDERGAYVPRRADGEFADDVVVFTRGDPPAVMSVVQRRALRRRGNWGETMIVLPEGAWHNLADDTEHRGAVRVADLLSDFPVALLEHVG